MSQAPTNQFDQQAERLIVETCQHPPGSFQRNSGLTEVFLSKSAIIVIETALQRFW